jgi:hypothetical protein
MMDKVDNIGEAECYVTPQGNAWNIKLLKTSPVNYFAYGSPVLAGDLDSDNHVEIVLVDGSPNLGTKLAILDDNLNLKYTLTSSENFTTVTVSFSMANVDGGPNAAIFIATYDTRQLKKFTLNTVSQTYEEAWSVSYSSNVNYDVGNPLITDFNGDGYAEVSVYDKIFDAQTGTLLASGNYLGTNTTSTANSYKFGMRAGHPTVGATKAEQASIMAAGDIDGDGLPELVGGNCVYKVIINSRTNSALNSFTLLRQTNTTGHPEASDGPTSLADMDLDGKLDAVVTLVDINWYAYGLYIWNPRTGEVMHSNVINNLNPGNHSGSGGFGPSLAAVGNLDTDPVPEIAFIGMTVMYVYDYNPETKQLIQKWNMSVNDESAITLFDFNQDNKLELVYRDFTRLMVIEGETHTVLTSIACGSGTANEYPLILDVNNDGHAEFVIVAGANNALTGTVRIYGMETWAPARKVWNQYAYNSVNVNDDLTIPAVQMNPATVFPGPDGQLGTSDDIRPYNNFLQQQTTLSKNGTSYWEASDYAIEGIPNAVYDEIGDFLDISFCVKNYGDIQGTPPFYVSVYQNARQAGNAVVTKSFSSIPAAGQIECGYSIRIENVKATVSINSLHLWLNDSGNGTSANPECDYTNGVVVYDVTGTVNAQNDYASMFACGEVSIPILNNDEYSGTTFTVLNTPKYGTAVQSGGRLKYTSGKSGVLPCEQTGNRIDTVHYRIESIVSHAEAYATVKIYSTPEMILENACSTSPKIVLSSSYEGFTYKWEYSPDGASGWQVLSTDSSSTELNSVQEGFYRITVSYDSGKTYQLKKGIEVVANRTAVLPGGTVWYDMSFNPVNISWQ